MKRTLAILAVLGITAGVVHFLQSQQRRTSWRTRGGTRGYYDGEPLPDDILEQRVQHALERIGADTVDARVANGTIVLRGRLPRVERDRALGAVLAVPGVTQVANYLEADAPERPVELREAFPGG